MYLLSQIWLFLLIAFLLGALTAWLFLGRGRGGDGLQGELDTLRTERDDLATRLAAAGAGATVTVQADAQKIARLEAELAEARVQAAADGEDEAITALRWRNRFLESRIKFLEEAPAAAPVAAPAVGLMAAAPATTSTPVPARVRAPAPKAAAPKAAAPKAAAPRAAAPTAAAPKAGAPKAAAPKAAAPKAAAPKAAAKSAAKAEPKPYQMSEAGSMSPAALEAAVEAAGAGRKPRPSRSAGGGDDLLLILGVGPKNKSWLNEQGIFTFRQIAQMSIPELAWLSQNLPTFGNRVYRENWVAQCDRLMRGLSPKP